MNEEEYVVKWLKLAFNTDWEKFHEWFKLNSNWKDTSKSLIIIKNKDLISVNWLLNVYNMGYNTVENKWLNNKNIESLKPYSKESILNQMEFSSPFELFDVILVTMICTAWSNLDKYEEKNFTKT